MSSEELKTIVKLIELKEIQSGHIFYQRYAEAATARDNERVYEWKLLKILGYQEEDENTNDTHRYFSNREILLNEYFLNKWGIEYPKNMNSVFKTNILRQIKLNELGI